MDAIDIAEAARKQAADARAAAETELTEADRHAKTANTPKVSAAEVVSAVGGHLLEDEGDAGLAAPGARVGAPHVRAAQLVAEPLQLALRLPQLTPQLGHP